MTKTNENEDPRLKKAEKEISAILDKYEIGGAIAMVSDSHAQYLLKFPKWSLVKFEGDNLRMKTDHKRPELTNQSAHLLFALRDMLGLQYVGLQQASDAFIKAIEAKGGVIDHNPFGGD